MLSKDTSVKNVLPLNIVSFRYQLGVIGWCNGSRYTSSAGASH